MKNLTYLKQFSGPNFFPYNLNPGRTRFFYIVIKHKNMSKIEKWMNFYSSFRMLSQLNATSGKLILARSCDLFDLFLDLGKNRRKNKVWICLIWWKIWILQKILGSLHINIIKFRRAVTKWRPCKVSDYTRSDLVSVTFDLSLNILFSRLLINTFQCVIYRFHLEFYVDFKYDNYF